LTIKIELKGNFQFWDFFSICWTSSSKKIWIKNGVRKIWVTESIILFEKLFSIFFLSCASFWSITSPKKIQTKAENNNFEIFISYLIIESILPEMQVVQHQLFETYNLFLVWKVLWIIIYMYKNGESVCLLFVCKGVCWRKL